MDDATNTDVQLRYWFQTFEERLLAASDRFPERVASEAEKRELGEPTILPERLAISLRAAQDDPEQTVRMLPSALHAAQDIIGEMVVHYTDAKPK